jgi:hypothetical protein
MSHDEYRRLHAACIAMARQSSLPDVQARWLAMSAALLERAADHETHDRPSRSVRSQRVHAAKYFHESHHLY